MCIPAGYAFAAFINLYLLMKFDLNPIQVLKLYRCHFHLL
jgi:hypothetical protein